MNKFTFTTTHKKIIADMLTPVSIFLRIRSQYKQAVLLESSDYHGDEHNFSYICFNAIAGFKVNNNTFEASYPDNTIVHNTITPTNLPELIQSFLQEFDNPVIAELQHIIYNGLFGYTCYDAIQYFEDIQIQHNSNAIPVLHYSCYQYILAFNHFNQELYIIINQPQNSTTSLSFQEIETLIKYSPITLDQFVSTSPKKSVITDTDFLQMVEKGKRHCYRGDVFQIVLSRQFTKEYKGDDFNVYRALRSINPSPYCFYFSFDTFSLMGSSPEAQLIIKNNKVTIHPIAGTFKRTGNDIQDAELAKQLAEDPKENAEHIMLVDLARNDLSINGKHTNVEVYKEVQYYSHVIHLVSKVSSNIEASTNKIKLFGNTFPAGTLSGAPKYKAMQLIDNIETTARGFYGGAIGHLSFSGDMNQAIMIRTFLSKDNILTYQAGAGIVADSKPESELQEVENKLNALNKAIDLAILL